MKGLSKSIVMVFFVCLGLALAACSSENDDEQEPTDTLDVGEQDVSTDLSTEPDAEPRDTATDLQEGPFPLPELAEDSGFKVGAAAGLLPGPLGMPTVGNMPAPGIKSPYTDNFSASTYAYLYPTVQVIALEGGTERLLLVRLDLIGINVSYVNRVAAELSEVTGYDWAGKVIVGTTHTHSGPGRFGAGFVFSVMADTFFPHFFDRLVKDTVDLAVEAILDMEDGKMGYGEVETDQLHNDRRCENPELRDDRVRILRFDRDDDSVKALVLVHSVHGTVIGPGEHYLSRDVVGGIETKVSESFDQPVAVMFLQAGAGDMSPGGPPVDESSPLPVIPHDHSRIEKVGEAAADAVQSVVWDIATEADVSVSSVSHYPPISREALGYKDGEFPFEGGGAYCGTTMDSECWTEDAQPIEDLDKMCLDIEMYTEAAGNKESAPDRTLITAARLNDILLVTIPGEPVTQIMLDVEEGIAALFPDQKHTIVMGYSQDYIGYSTPEWDWYLGGYEASGAIWGPKQGDYLAAKAIEIAATILDDSRALPFDGKGPFPLLKPANGSFLPSGSAAAPAVKTEPAEKVAVGETVVFEFTGGDPWFLLPTVILEKEAGGDFKPVLRKNQTVVDSTGYEFGATVTYDPTYKDEPKAKTRTFVWMFELPTDRRVASSAFPMSGTYRLRATGRYLPEGSKDPAGSDYELVSADFVVE